MCSLILLAHQVSILVGCGVCIEDIAHLIIVLLQLGGQLPLFFFVVASVINSPVKIFPLNS